MAKKTCGRCGSDELETLSTQRKGEVEKTLLECAVCGIVTEVVAINRPVLAGQS